MMATLAEKRCAPCEGGASPLGPDAVGKLYAEIPQWRIIDGKRLWRACTFQNFREALSFVNGVGALAEAEGHHPDIRFGWGYVEVTLTTHAIGGLSENDFILAAKIDALGIHSKSEDIA